MRAAFLSPASRPSSSVLWTPPVSSYLSGYPASSSHTTLPRKAKPPMPSSRLSHKLSNDEKPWLKERDCRDRASWWLTFLVMLLGVGAGVAVCFFNFRDVKLLRDADLCMVLNENFDSLDLNNRWTRDVELSGFGNGEFQMATASNDNLFVRNGELYILPTLTSDVIGRQNVLNGYTYNITGCTNANRASSPSLLPNPPFPY